MCAFKEEERSVLISATLMKGITGYKVTVQLLAARSVCRWRIQPCDSYLKERFLSFVCLFIYLFIYFAIRISRFFLVTFFVIRIFLSAFSHPHPPSADIRSAFYRHPAKIYSALSFDRINFFNVANLLLLSRKAFVICYCIRVPIKTIFFDACQSDCQIVRPALVSGIPNRKKPYNKHLFVISYYIRYRLYGIDVIYIRPGSDAELFMDADHNFSWT